MTCYQMSPQKLNDIHDIEPIVIIQWAVGALVFELVAPPLEQIYTKPKQLGLVLENTY